MKRRAWDEGGSRSSLASHSCLSSGKALQSLGVGTPVSNQKKVSLLPQLKETNLGSHYSEKVFHGKDTRTKEMT